jgi:hypothetical protein
MRGFPDSGPGKTKIHTVYRTPKFSSKNKEERKSTQKSTLKSEQRSTQKSAHKSTLKSTQKSTHQPKHKSTQHEPALAALHPSSVARSLDPCPRTCLRKRNLAVSRRELHNLSLSLGAGRAGKRRSWGSVRPPSFCKTHRNKLGGSPTTFPNGL